MDTLLRTGILPGCLEDVSCFPLDHEARDQHDGHTNIEKMTLFLADFAAECPRSVFRTYRLTSDLCALLLTSHLQSKPSRNMPQTPSALRGRDRSLLSL